LERLAACTEYGPVDARADKMVAEELTQLTSRAIAFPKPDVWESCDRPSSSIDLLIAGKTIVIYCNDMGGVSPPLSVLL